MQSKNKSTQTQKPIETETHHYHDRVHVGHVNTVLDDGRRQQHVSSAQRELQYNVFEIFHLEGIIKNKKNCL